MAQSRFRPRTECEVRLNPLREMEFGHNGFYNKDEDTGKVTLTGDAYQCGFFVVFFSKPSDN